MRGKALKSLSLIIAIISASVCHAMPNPNKLLDIGILTKRDGKAIMLIFDRVVDRKSWKIRFSGKDLNIILYNFSTDLKREDLNFSSIPSLDHADISIKNNNITVSFTLRGEIKRLLNTGSLTFLTKDPHTLGIMFTRSYLDSLIPKASKDTPLTSKNNAPKKKIVKENKEKSTITKENQQSYNNKKENNKDKSIELPFVRYEDILGTETRDTAPAHKADNKVLKEKSSNPTKGKTLSEKKKMIPKPFVLKKSVVATGKNEPIERPRKEKGIEVFKIIASLSAVLGIIIISLFLWKKLLLFRYKGNQDLIKILGAYYFGSRQSIAVIQIEKERFLLGITPENINLLTRLNMKESEGNQMKISEPDLAGEDGFSQKAVNALKQRFDQLKRI